MSKKRDIPLFHTPIIETHCHLDYLDKEELQATLARAAEVGISKIITIAVSPDNLDAVLAIARSADNIWATQGVHPHEAEHFRKDTAEILRERASDPLVVAIGEIGLDYFYDHADRAVQRSVFEQQLQIATDVGLPVVIHSREADEDTQAILANFSTSLLKKGVIHSFTSGMDLAQYCLGEGFMLGFNGITTFNKAENVREVVAITPIEQLLLETDSPYLTPVPYRGKPNAPYYLPFIAEKVAAIKNIATEDLLAAALANSERLFFGAK